MWSRKPWVTISASFSMKWVMMTVAASSSSSSTPALSAASATSSQAISRPIDQACTIDSRARPWSAGARPPADALAPAMPGRGVGRVRALFLERGDVGLVLEVTRVDASGRRIEQPLDAMHARRVQRMDVDQHVVAADLGLVGMDEADAAHVGGQCIDLVDTTGRGQAIVPASQIEELELVRGRCLVLRQLDVHAPYPVAALDEELRQVMSDETTRTSHQHLLHDVPSKDDESQ